MSTLVSVTSFKPKASEQGKIQDTLHQWAEAKGASTTWKF